MTKTGINQPNIYGTTPLHYAAGPGDSCNARAQDATNIVQMLINDERTDINAVDKDGKTALMHAMNIYYPVTKMLITNDRVDVNIQNNVGETALHKAANATTWRHVHLTWDDTIELVQMLLQRKDFVAVAAKDYKNRTALNVAWETNFTQMAALLSTLK